MDSIEMWKAWILIKLTEGIIVIGILVIFFSIALWQTRKK